MRCGRLPEIPPPKFPSLECRLALVPCSTKSMQQKQHSGTSKQGRNKSGGRLNNGPQICPHPNPPACEYVTLYSKGDFAGTIKLRILREWDYPGRILYITLNIIMGVFVSGRGKKGQCRRWCDNQKQRLEWCGQEPMNAKSWKRRGTDSPTEPPVGQNLADAFLLAA